MIITDGTHIVSTESFDELHNFVIENKISSHFFHGSKKGHPHYDIPKKRRAEITSKIILQGLRSEHDSFAFVNSREILIASKKISSKGRAK